MPHGYISRETQSWNVKALQGRLGLHEEEAKLVKYCESCRPKFNRSIRLRNFAWWTFIIAFLILAITLAFTLSVGHSGEITHEVVAPVEPVDPNPPVVDPPVDPVDPVEPPLDNNTTNPTDPDDSGKEPPVDETEGTNPPVIIE